MQRFAPILAVLSLASFAAAQQLPCFETNLGTNLTLGDDTYSPAQPLGFSFTYNNVAYTDIVICSNGYIWFGNAAPTGVTPDYTPAESKLLTEGGARFCPLWCDFNPSDPASGNVHFNSFPAGGGLPARAVVTWSNVFEYGRTTPLTFQVTFTDAGTILLQYDANTAVVAGGFGTAPSLVGCSPGNGAAANPRNFSVLPIVTAGNATVHQSIARGAFPLAGRSMEFLPDGTGGYIIAARSQCGQGSFTPYGVGCPKNMTAYEHWATAGTFDLSNQSFQFISDGLGGYTVIPGPGLDTGYATPITLGDDQTSVQPIPFSFPFAGAARTSIGVCSNGILWMGPTTTVYAYPVATAVTTEAAPWIAGMWCDLDPASGGQTFWDVNSSRAMITWVNVPHWNQLGVVSTLQIKLLSNGDFILSYGACNNGSEAAAGLSEAQNCANPGPIDWLTAVPYSVGRIGQVPLTLAAQTGSRPAIGSTFNLVTSNIPNGTSFGIQILGFTRLSVNAAPLGLSGCTQYVSTDGLFGFLVNGNTATFPISIPNNPGLQGVTVLSQSATFSAGFNPIGVILSNGGEIKIGL